MRGEFRAYEVHVKLDPDFAAPTIEQQMVDLQEAVNILVLAQTRLEDWYGPAGTKLTSAYSYLRKQLHPLVSELLADPEVQA